LKKLLVVGREKGSMLHDYGKFVVHIGSETRHMCKFCVVPLWRRVLFWEVPFSEKLPEYQHTVSAVLGSGA
jgi:hypothetical protein